jgi:hypothetical protein
VSRNRPQWLRLDSDFADNPKVLRLKQRSRHASVALWVEALAYSARHLTDGWIPAPWPRQQGYRPRDCDALVEVALWVPLEITADLEPDDDGGWLINDYQLYQPTRESWTRRSEQQRINAQKRWGPGSRDGPP